VLMGDSVAGEILDSAIKVLNKVSEVYKLEFNYNYAPIGGRAYDETGVPLPEKTIETCLKSDAVLLGAVGDWKYDTLPPELRPERALLGIRKKLNLFANLRPVKVFDELLYASPLKPEIAQDVDVMIVRELTGDVYFGEPKGIEKKKTLDNREIKVGFNNMIYDEDEIRRIAHVAFKSAQRRKNRVCCVDKANVLDVSRLFREVTAEVAKEYSNVELSYMYVDNCAMQLVLNPRQFDVILTGNIFGDILSDEASTICGSLGMLPSASMSDGKTPFMYEPIHGSAPDIAGKNQVNPIATILSVAMMLYYSFNEKSACDSIYRAVKEVLREGYRTRDINQKDCELCTTSKITQLIIDKIR
ncbi:MAG: 3-isopropylmalate dehydrogenase, partial [Candidatus Gastranaerophilales bacterium]|nr:3-isopropylmalate dehydrogenase [Candidatus Gastranaerophilales bacterium]